MDKLNVVRYGLCLGLDHDNVLYLSFMTFVCISVDAIITLASPYGSRATSDPVRRCLRARDLLLFHFMKDNTDNRRYRRYNFDEKAAHKRLAENCLKILW